MRGYSIDPLRAIVVGTFALLIGFPAFFSWLSDDAYIHARIAERMHDSGEPYFNQGDAFKAGSSTGYILVMAGLRHALSAEQSIRTITAISLGILTVLVFHAIQLIGVRGPLQAFHVVGVLGASAWAGYGGMETPLASVFVTAAVIAQLREKPHLAVAMLAMAACFRFEMLALLIAFGALTVWNQRSARILPALLPLLCLMAIELHYFGGVYPNAAKAKAVAYGFSLRESIKTNLSFGFMGSACWFGVLGLCVTSLAALLVMLRTGLVQTIILAFFGFSALLLAVWAVSRSLIFPWYYGLFATPFVLGTAMLQRIEHFPGKSLILGGCFVIVGLLGYLGATGAAYHLPADGNPTADRRVVEYLRIGQLLYEDCPACSVVTSEIGGLGYGFKGVVHDAFALADPEALQFHPLSVPAERSSRFAGAIPPRYVEFRDPELIVSMAGFSEALRRSASIKRYVRFDCPLQGDAIWGDTSIQVYAKPNVSLQALRTRGGCIQVK